ncbi:MAG: restriction endonuclease [bacterium]|nr:restriction endonuclease [bacterium]
MTNPQKEIFVIKASGEKELFSDLKLRNSLEKAKTPLDVTEKIIDQIRSGMKDGMKTSDIYRYAFLLLRKHDRSTAGRYSLKQAVMELGPSGHPFEKFVGELLKTRGFAIKVGEVVQGICVSHEIDVMAEKDESHIMVECKFHNQSGIKSDVKVTLYVQARFEDVQRQWQKQPNHGKKFHEIWLITNTKLTSDAIQYASCVGMKAIGWSYPPNGSLQNLIENAGIHPLTCLTTLSNIHKRLLLDRGLVLCKEILENKTILQGIGFNESKIKQIKQEINNLCKVNSRINNLTQQIKGVN